MIASSISVAARERPAWAKLELPQRIDPGADENYDDLRIVDDRDDDTPYILMAPEGSKPLDATSQIVWREPDRTSVLTLDTGTLHTLVTRIHFRTTQAEFSREVTLTTSNDGQEWIYAGDSGIQRFANGQPELDLNVPDGSARYVRAEISNESDAPLPNLHASLFGPRREAVFVARPGRSYALMRRPDARAPDYDLRALFEHDRPHSFAPANVADTTRERRLAPGSRTSKSLILTLAFAAAIAALAGLTLATLKPQRAG